MATFYEVKLAEPSLSIDITTLLNDHLSFGLLSKSDVDKMILNQQIFCLHRSGSMIGVMTIKRISNLQEFLLGNLDAELLVTQSVNIPHLR